MGSNSIDLLKIDGSDLIDINCRDLRARSDPPES